MTRSSVIAGNDKGVEGKVIEVLTEVDRVIVEGVNRVKRHTRIGQGERGATTGGIITAEAPIHISNVMLVVERRRRQDHLTRRLPPRRGHQEPS